MPNLFSDLPVEILACEPESTSGLTRTEIRAVRPGLAGQPRQQFELRLGFDVDAENVLGQRRAQFGLGLADAGEQDLVRRNAGGQRPLQLAAGHHVGAGAELRQCAQHRLVGVRLHGVAHQRLLAGEGLAEHPVVALQRRGRIAIERRADRFRQLDKIDRLGVQHAVAIVEVIHGRLSREADRGRRLSCGLSARWPTVGSGGRIECALRGPFGFGIGLGRAAADCRLRRGVGRQIEPALAAAAPERQHGRAQNDDGPSRRCRAQLAIHDKIPNAAAPYKDCPVLARAGRP